MVTSHESGVHIMWADGDDTQKHIKTLLTANRHCKPQELLKTCNKHYNSTGMHLPPQGISAPFEILQPLHEGAGPTFSLC